MCHERQTEHIQNMHTPTTNNITWCTHAHICWYTDRWFLNVRHFILPITFMQDQCHYYFTDATNKCTFFCLWQKTPKNDPTVIVVLVQVPRNCPVRAEWRSPKIFCKHISIIIPVVSIERYRSTAYLILLVNTYYTTFYILRLLVHLYGIPMMEPIPGLKPKGLTKRHTSKDFLRRRFFVCEVTYYTSIGEPNVESTNDTGRNGDASPLRSSPSADDETLPSNPEKYQNSQDHINSQIHSKINDAERTRIKNV
jgi:hypothetical protein